MDADFRAQLQRSLGSTYTLERELGGGGMSRVFVATGMMDHAWAALRSDPRCANFKRWRDVP